MTLFPRNRRQISNHAENNWSPIFHSLVLRVGILQCILQMNIIYYIELPTRKLWYTMIFVMIYSTERTLDRYWVLNAPIPSVEAREKICFLGHYQEPSLDMQHTLYYVFCTPYFQTKTTSTYLPFSTIVHQFQIHSCIMQHTQFHPFTLVIIIPYPYTSSILQTFISIVLSVYSVLTNINQYLNY